MFSVIAQIRRQIIFTFASLSSHSTSPSSSGLNTPKHWSPSRRLEQPSRKHSPLQSNLGLGAFRGRTLPPSNSNRDSSLSLPLNLPIGIGMGGNGEFYSEPPDAKDIDRVVDRDRDRRRHYSRETTLTDTDNSDRNRPRSGLIDSSSTSYTGSFTGVCEAASVEGEGDPSRLSIPALLRLQLRSRPIDISNKRVRSSDRKGWGKAGGGVRTQSEEEVEEEEERQYSDKERRRTDSPLAPSSAKRFMKEVVRSSVSFRTSLPHPHRTRTRTRTRTHTDTDTDHIPQEMQMQNRRGCSGASSASVSPEALLTALTMSMDEKSSSLAMVV